MGIIFCQLLRIGRAAATGGFAITSNALNAQADTAE
jgi:hypothetical protein